MKLFFTLFIALITYSVNGQATALDLDSYSKLKVGGNFNVEILEGDHQASIILEDCTMDDLDINVSAGTLSITFSKSKNYSKKKKATITLKTQKLTSIQTSASAQVHSTHTWESDHMHIDASSASKIAMIQKSQSTDIKATSGSEITVSGHTRALDVNASSGAEVRTKDLVADKAEINASSGANIQIDPQNELKVDVSSGASVKYKKRPYGAKLKKSSGASIGKL